MKARVFEEYFEMGQQEILSPFITPSSRSWGKALPLKSSFLAAFFRLLSFFFSYSEATHPLSHALLLFVYFLAGTPSLIDSIEDLLNLEVNIDMLMTLAAFSSIFIGSGMEGGLLLVLFSLAGSMEEAVTAKAKSAIQSLNKLSPTEAIVILDNNHHTPRAIRAVEVGTLILVKSGQIVPLDGEVIEGESSVNLVHLTGENFPVRKKIGDSVPAGGRNLEGALKLRVTKNAADSTLSKIIELVTQAQDAKPKLQRWFDQLSRTYALSIISLAAFFSLTFPLILNIPFLGEEGALYRSLAFLIAASPCALIIALPIAYLSAISVCAKQGILLKGGVTLDALASCKQFVFDKTGTLTTGDLKLNGIESVEKTGISTEYAMQIAFTLEQNAQHPIAKAIIDRGQQQQLTPLSLSGFSAVPGAGLQGIVEGEHVYMGHPQPILDQLDSAQKNRLETMIERLRRGGELIALLKVNDALFFFRFTDTPRKNIKKTLNALQSKWGLKLTMLTGDHHENAQRIADDLQLNHFEADLTPEEKLTKVASLAQEMPLAMVGDGINDAPALARATVGICMGKVGTTAAIDASDIVLLQDNIELLDWLFGKAKHTQTIISQNLIIAAGAILVAALPALLGIVPLWLAVILHEGGTILVGINALRLLKN